MTTAAWASQAERGALGPLRLLLWLALRLGPVRARWLLPPLVGAFLLFAAQPRAASRDYLSRLYRRPARLAEVARHFHCFAAAVLDRVFLLAGRVAEYRITVQGQEHVLAALKGGQGCILLGAHLGSFEVLRGIADQAPAPVRPFMYRRNGGALTALLDQLSPGIRESVIEIGTPESMLLAREALARGEMVALLADRTPDTSRSVVVPFLGAPARFPVGPFVLAAALGVPVVLCLGLRQGPGRYMVRFQHFSWRLELHRHTRAHDLLDCVARYAQALEAGCLEAPYNWFNFFPFWKGAPHAEAAAPPAARAAAAAADAGAKP